MLLVSNTVAAPYHTTLWHDPGLLCQTLCAGAMRRAWASSAAPTLTKRLLRSPRPYVCAPHQLPSTQTERPLLSSWDAMLSRCRTPSACSQPADFGKCCMRQTYLDQVLSCTAGAQYLGAPAMSARTSVQPALPFTWIIQRKR